MAIEVETEREDGRRTRGRRTRASILDTAADLASVDGLEGLTIGRLAAAIGMSKSGLFAHFGSKEELQVATYFHARERFLAEVVLPPREFEPGRERVDALVAGWLRYMRTDVFRGGCFFSEVRTEFGSREDGPVRQVVVKGHAPLAGPAGTRARRAGRRPRRGPAGIRDRRARHRGQLPLPAAG